MNDPYDSIVITDDRSIPDTVAYTFTKPVNIFIEAQYASAKLIRCVFEHPTLLSFKGSRGCVIDLTGCVFKHGFHLMVENSTSCEVVLMGATLSNGFKIDSDSDLDLNCALIKWDTEIDMEGAVIRWLRFDQAKFLSQNSKHVVRASSLRISRELSFKDAEIGDCQFEGAMFQGSVNFDRAKLHTASCYSAVFEGDFYCNQTEFGKAVLFNGSTFKGKIVAPSLNTESHECIADFSGCTFHSNVYFNFSRFKSFTCKRSTFMHPASFNATVFTEADFAETFFQTGANFTGTKYEQGEVETFRLIKSQLTQSGNRIDSLYYQAKELRLYDTALKWRYHWREKVLLWLNRYSTDYGVNWARGVGFTLVISTLFYTAYIISVPCKQFEWGWKDWDGFMQASHYVVGNYFNFLALFRDFNLLHQQCQNMFSSAIDFIGRIFIAYGVYQTIQAFRKYGKI